MIFKKFVMRAMTAAVIVQALPPGIAPAAPLPEVFTFAAGYALDAPAMHNIVELGVLRNCGEQWCVDIERFDSARMLPRVPTEYMHEMHAPYGGGASCFNGPVTTIHGELTAKQTATLHQENDGFSLTVSGMRYRWVVDPAVPAGYTLSGIVSESRSLQQAVGFGFNSESEVKGNVTPSQLAAYYNGQIYAKTALTKASGDWSHAQSSHDFRVYTPSQNGEVLFHSLPGLASVVQKYGKPMWVQSTVVLVRSAGTIAPLVEEYGHDFNMDGCFNESGHNKLMLPIGRSDVSGLVYIEYTSDYQRGFPMISVGRYYR